MHYTNAFALIVIFLRKMQPNTDKCLILNHISKKCYLVLSLLHRFAWIMYSWSDFWTFNNAHISTSVWPPCELLWDFIYTVIALVCFVVVLYFFCIFCTFHPHYVYVTLPFCRSWTRLFWSSGFIGLKLYTKWVFCSHNAGSRQFFGHLWYINVHWFSKVYTPLF